MTISTPPTGARTTTTQRSSTHRSIIIALTIVSTLVACSEGWVEAKAIAASSGGSCFLTADSSGLVTPQCVGFQVPGLPLAYQMFVNQYLIAPPLPPSATYGKLYAGWAHYYALRSSGDVVAWGIANYPQFQINDVGQLTIPLILQQGTPANPVSACTVGMYHTCCGFKNAADPLLAQLQRYNASLWQGTSYALQPSIPVSSGMPICFGDNSANQLNFDFLANGYTMRWHMPDSSAPDSWPPNITVWDTQKTIAFRYYTCALMLPVERTQPVEIIYNYTLLCFGTQIPLFANHANSIHIAEVRPPNMPALASETNPSLSITDLAGTDDSVCALFSDRSVRCYGNGPSHVSSVPIVNLQPLRCVQIACGAHHCICIQLDGTLKGWGLNIEGQLDTPSGRYSQVIAGYYHNVAIRIDGTVASFGVNNFGQLQIPTQQLTDIACGTMFTCGIIDAQSVPSFMPQVVCWGETSQLDIPEPLLQHATPDDPRPTARAIYAGMQHVCVLTIEKDAICWGDNNAGQIDVPPNIKFSELALSSTYSCGLRAGDATVVCWGFQVGETKEVATFLKSTPFQHIDSGWDITCGMPRLDPSSLQQSAWIYCWPVGPQRSGEQLAKALAANNVTSIASVAASYQNACSLDVVGHVFCGGTDVAQELSLPVGVLFEQIEAGVRNYEKYQSHRYSLLGLCRQPSSRRATGFVR